MKRMVMIVAALIISATMSLVQAQSEGKAVFKADIDKLSSYLKLAPHQRNYVETINVNFIKKQMSSLGNEACQQEVVMKKWAG